MERYVNNIKDEMAMMLFGRTHTDAIAKGTCVSCEDIADTFRDDISEKEYKISALCQKCQDDIFFRKEDD